MSVEATHFVNRFHWSTAHIAAGSVASKTLEALLVGSVKSVQLERDSVSLFHHTPKLRNLTLIQLKIPPGDAKYLGDLISPLVNLRNLTLKFASISVLPNGFLRNATKLNSLTLIGNFFSKWDLSIFPNTASLRFIDFGLNHITEINEHSFPKHV